MAKIAVPYSEITNKRRNDGKYPAKITRAYKRVSGKFIPIGYHVVWSDQLVAIYLDEDL